MELYTASQHRYLSHVKRNSQRRCWFCSCVTFQSWSSAVTDDLMTMNDISVDESEDLPKILGPLVEEGPVAALGRAHQSSSHSSNTALSPATNRRQLLQTMKLAAPAIVKLQVCPSRRQGTGHWPPCQQPLSDNRCEALCRELLSSLYVGPMDDGMGHRKGCSNAA